MIEVTSKNFEVLWPDIKSSIRNSSFVAIDTEFTGLYASNEFKSSLFDNAQDRYQKQRVNASKFVICQFGLTTFERVRDNNFIANTFQFYLKPCAFGTIDKEFSIQTSSLEFLCNHKFDFNKFLKDGVSYLNEDEEKIIFEEIKSNSFLSTTDRNVNEYTLQSICSKISEWLPRARGNETLIIENSFNVDDIVERYVTVKDLRIKFKLIWAHYNVNNPNLIIEKVSPERRKTLELESGNEDMQILQYFVGFSRVFKELVSVQKPLVGHNLMTDLVLMYHHFYRPLPKSFSQFKNDIIKLFPIIYDTKHILSSLQLSEHGSNLKQLRSLEELYSFFIQRKSFRVPKVSMKVDGDKEIEVTPHHAGFDAFACGYSLLRLAHVNGLNHLTHSEVHVLTWNELLSALEPFQNKVNLIRASIHYVDLTKKDLKSIRPQWLLLRTKQGQLLDVNEVTNRFSTYGTVDIQQINHTTALVATGNFLCVRDIFRAFREDKLYSIVLYNPIKHSKMGKMSIWASCIGFWSLSAFCVWKLLSN